MWAMVIFEMLLCVSNIVFSEYMKRSGHYDGTILKYLVSMWKTIVEKSFSTFLGI